MVRGLIVHRHVGGRGFGQENTSRGSRLVRECSRGMLVSGEVWSDGKVRVNMVKCEIEPSSSYPFTQRVIRGHRPGCKHIDPRLILQRRH